MKKLKKFLIFFSTILLIVFFLNYFQNLKNQSKCYPFPDEIDGYNCIEQDILKESRIYPFGCGNENFNPDSIYIVKYANNSTTLDFYAVKADYFNLEKCPKANFDYINSINMISKDINLDENQKKAYFDLKIDDQNFQRIMIWTRNDYYFMFNNSNKSQDNFLSKEKLNSLIPEFENLIKG